MTLNDLLKRIKNEDPDKMVIFQDADGGWDNINVKVTKSDIIITTDGGSPFSSDN